MIGPLIQKLRAKPKDAKNTIALSAAGVFTAFIFVVWLTTSTGQLSDVVDSTMQSAGAFSTFTDQIKERFDAVNEQIPDVDEFARVASSSLQDRINAASVAPELIDFESGTSTEQKRSIRIATTTKAQELEPAQEVQPTE